MIPSAWGFPPRLASFAVESPVSGGDGAAPNQKFHRENGNKSLPRD
jgi:hypothetical protein